MELQTDKELKPIPIWSKIVCWPFGVFFASAGILATLADPRNVGVSLAALAIGCMLIPPIRLFTAEKTGIEIPTWGRCLLFFTLLSLMLTLMPAPEENSLTTQIDATDPEAAISMPNVADLIVKTKEEEPACIPQALSLHARHTKKLYDELQSFKDETQFLDRGFVIGGPYNDWQTRTRSLDDTLTISDELTVQDEFGITPTDLLMLGLSYVANSESEIYRYEKAIADATTRLQCTASESNTARMVKASTEARDRWVSPVNRAPADADDFDEKVINPCLQVAIDANPALRGQIFPWALRNTYPETFETMESLLREAWEIEAKPIWDESNRSERAKAILFKYILNNCIAGVKGGSRTELPDAELLELLSTPQ